MKTKKKPVNKLTRAEAHKQKWAKRVKEFYKKYKETLSKLAWE